MGEWLTRPAVADVAINKILANGTVVAGRGATFVNVHFAEIPHEACRTAGETHHILKRLVAVSELSRASRRPGGVNLEEYLVFHYLSKSATFFPLLFPLGCSFLFPSGGKKKTKPERFNRRISEAGNKIQRSSCSSNIESICNTLTVSNIYF